ncbi:ATP-binding protein [Leptolyngbya sp. PL-A3]|uniref:ATP-binding protein n=1 Tax=Leptolyngbya sp. PL-A3 TaxID=2933911 RepID=UPI00329A27BE
MAQLWQAVEQVFVGDSEMALLMRSQDWSQTPLGAVETWPQSLRSALSICLNSRFPIAIYWGQECILLYNDAWRPIVGNKHSWALGRSAREVWSEIWDDIGPELAGVLATGKGTFHKDDLLSMHRFGYTEECYFEYTFNPIQGERGMVEGVFNIVTETTYRVLNDRRAQLLREIASKTGIAKTTEEACVLMLETFQSGPFDIPFALLYLIDSDEKHARLCNRIEVVPGSPISPAIIDLTTEADSKGWPIALATRTAQPQVVTDLVARFGNLPGSPWAEPPQEALVLPISTSGQSKVSGVLVVVASPRRRLDDPYRDFFTQVAGQVATAIANAQAYEEERKRAEALAELDRAKTTFFSNISHEFRTPLTLMLGPLQETLNRLDGHLPPDEREQLQMVQHNGLRLLKLVNSLLDFSRLEAGRVQAVYEPTDLATFTVELASVFRSTIQQAGLQLIVNCEPLAEPVYVDRGMWEKIVFNLLSNAFKFTFTGEIAVTLHQVGGQVELTVRDTGIGIPTVELPRLFERFHRVEGAQGRTQEGSGIGLALVQELVRLHGGQIQVESTEGLGTTFIITISLGSAHLPSDRVQSARSLASSPSNADLYVEEALRWLPGEETTTSEYATTTLQIEQTTGLPHRSLSASSLPPARILLVDDNADMRSYVKRLLLSQGYEVETATDGMAALAMSQQQVPDLVLTDVMMPCLDGFGLLRELRLAPMTREVPIILLSARAGEEARIEGLEAGADDYLTKPFSARELLARVEANLKLAQLRQEATQREQALRLESENARQTTETILSSISDGFYTLDRHWCFTYANDRLCELAGKPREELLGYNNWELFPAAIGTDVYVQFHRALHEQLPLQFEYLYLPWNRWFEYRVYPSVNGLTIFAAEVTERKRSNLLLVEQKQLLERVASGHPLDECLAAVCHAIASLNAGTRACFLLADEERQTFLHAIMSDLPSSFRQKVENLPINDLCIGTCGEAVYRGEPITCADIANDDRWSQGWRDLCVDHGILACHSTPIIDSDRSPIGSLMLCFDKARHPTAWEHQLADFGTQIASIVFERDRAQVALRKSEEQFRLFVTASSDMMYRMSADWTEMLALDGKDFLTSTTNSRAWLEAYIPLEDQPKVMDAIQEAVQTKSIFELEHRVIQSSGLIGWTFSRAIPLLNLQGEIVEWFGAARNITDRKQAEMETAADLGDTQLLHNLSARLVSEDNIQALYQEIIVTAIALTHADAGSVQIFDQATQDLLLLATQGFEKAMVDHFYRVNIGSHTSCGIALKGGTRSFVDFDAPESEDPDGSLRMHVKAGYRSAQSTPLISRSGKLIGMVSTHWRTRHRPSDRELRFLDLLARQATDLIEQRQDEAERKQLLAREQTAREEAETANRIKDEFLAVLSHELRSPLNPILGWSRLLQNSKLDEVRTKQALTTIERNAKLQAELIEDLLDVSRILQGKLSLTVSPINLASTIKSAIETVRLAAEAKSIAIETPLDSTMGLVAGDATRLQQVVWNLLSNAVKFTPAGGQVTVRLEQVDHQARITVTDTGKGIAPDFLPYVFDYFRQADSATTRKFGGLGLGLAIVRHLVELHGGTIQADSSGEGLGATFTVHLPLMQASPPIEQRSLSSQQFATLQGTHVLVVDDDTDTRDFIEFLLQQAGARVVASASAEAALTALMQFQPDVLVSDIGMPEMDGYTLMQRVRALPPEQGGQIPAIALTAYAGEFDQRQALSVGFQRHVPKPVEPEKLVEVIVSLLNNNAR